jgi:hypothetical protein
VKRRIVDEEENEKKEELFLPFDQSPAFMFGIDVQGHKPIMTLRRKIT